MAIDFRAHNLNARTKLIDKDLLPEKRVPMQWQKVPGSQGGGRIGTVSGVWWVGQVRVRKGKGGTIWSAQFSLDDGQVSQIEGIAKSYGEGETTGIRWLNDKMIDWAETRTKVRKCRLGPWEYDGTEVRGVVIALVKAPERGWWQQIWSRIVSWVWASRRQEAISG